MYKKVSIEEELPPIDEFVTCFYDSGETMVYKITSLNTAEVESNLNDWAWTMRDGVADRTPKEGKITHWLKEVEEISNKPISPLNYLSLDTMFANVEIQVNGISVIMPSIILKEMIGQYIYKTKIN